MTTVQVDASKSYSIEIGSGLLDTLGEKLNTLGNVQKVALISDSTVWTLHGKSAENAIVSSGLELCTYVFPAGEESKNGENFLKILNFLAENQLTRTDMIVALGGGVTGDLAGFCAASYLRGIRFVQVPTTLLAAVDSSVGGKTAIDLPAGKNLAGAFCQPSFVLCDLDLLNTLPEDIFRDGCAEIIKTAILFDPELFSLLMDQGIHFPREKVIAACVGHKRDVVNADEFDLGLRQKLNLGHTIGHGVEAMSNFTLSHGKSVAIGTAIVARSAERQGICSLPTRTSIEQILDRFALPTSTGFTAVQLSKMALEDKKRKGNTINLILPEAIGSCIIKPIPVCQLESFIEAGLI